jgi:hypothetical protein
MEYKEVWHDMAGIARIYPYDPSGNGALYIAKSAYAFKRGEIDFIGPWGFVDQIMKESYSVLDLFAVRESQ